MKKAFYWCCCTLLSFLAIGCCPHPPIPVSESERTVLIYMVANNNLHSFAKQNIDQIIHSVNTDILQKGNLLIYYVPSNKTSQRLLSVRINKGRGDTLCVKEYHHENSLDKHVMSKVLKDAYNYAPANEYDLILWSHCTGWLPEKSTKAILDIDYQKIMKMGLPITKSETRYFGQDGSHYMSIPDLRDALMEAGHPLSFIMMDACFSAGVEMIYELKDCADYLIGSTAEVMAFGFPYSQLAEILFQDTFEPQQLCEAIYQFYKDYTWPSATTSLIDLSQMEALAESVRAVLADQAHALQDINYSDIQAYEKRNPHLFYDLDDYIRYRCSSPSRYADFQECLRKTVLCNLYTEQVYSIYGSRGFFDLPSSCGLSCYIPYPNTSISEIQHYNEHYYKTSWALATEPQ